MENLREIDLSFRTDNGELEKRVGVEGDLPTLGFLDVSLLEGEKKIREKKFAVAMIDKLNKQRASLSYKKGCCTWSPMSEAPELCIIKLLLQKHKDAVYVPDKDGLTPVLRAAVQSESQLRVIKVILEECPESSEICDRKGSTILLLVRFRCYEEAKWFIEIPQILALKDQRNNLGNTPAHLAVMRCKKIMVKNEKKQDKKVINEQIKVCIEDHHVGMIRALLESSANFTLKNKKGQSAAALFQSLMPYFRNNNNGSLQELDMEIKEQMTKNKQMMLLSPEESSPRSKDEHNKKIWEAIEKGSDLNLLSKELSVLESWLSDGLLTIGDLLHTLLQARKTTEASYNDIEEFMIEFFNHNLVLLCQTNLRGDTFIHTMVRDEQYEISESFSTQMQSLCKNNEHSYCPPWKMRNIEGNTPLHEALLHAPKPGNVNDGLDKQIHWRKG